MYAGHFDFDHPLLWTVPDVLPPDDCRDLIQRAEACDWLEGTLNSAHGRVRRAEVRDNHLAVLPPDPALHQRLTDLLLPHLPPRLRGCDRVGLTHALRVYRYQIGQHFGLHRDQSYAEDGHISQLTLLLYLNDDFEGGQTDFPELKQTITPQTGHVLLFQHMLLHSGAHVTAGAKYLLRADVLYTAPKT